MLYPTAGLAVGRIMSPEWVVIACKAFDTWLYEKFLHSNSRLKGVALVPLQNGELLGGPKEGEKASDYFKKQLREGRIFVGFDCDNDGLNTAVAKGGKQSFLFGSDFPHEVFDAAKCRHEIDELLGCNDLTQEDKEAVLGGNAARFYLPAL